MVLCCTAHQQPVSPSSWATRGRTTKRTLMNGKDRRKYNNSVEKRLYRFVWSPNFDLSGLVVDFTRSFSQHSSRDNRNTQPPDNGNMQSFTAHRQIYGHLKPRYTRYRWRALPNCMEVPSQEPTLTEDVTDHPSPYLPHKKKHLTNTINYPYLYGCEVQKVYIHGF